VPRSFALFSLTQLITQSSSPASPPPSSAAAGPTPSPTAAARSRQGWATMRWGWVHPRPFLSSWALCPQHQLGAPMEGAWGTA